MQTQKRIVIIGGGASGIFAAALCAEKIPNSHISVLEKTRQLLAKVRISGGGRCNVTHAQFDPKLLSGFYPRGHKELLGPFHHFQPKDTIAWFQSKGVALKTEEDGRIFPTTDRSETIIDCLLHAAQSKGVEIQCETSLQSIQKNKEGFLLTTQKQEILECDALILATGSSSQGHVLAASLGHTIVPSVPSLFTFNVPTSALLDLSGIALSDVQLTLKGTHFKQRGNLLLTHFGFSGPAALKLSAWAARELHACHYETSLQINWIPEYTSDRALATLKALNPCKTLYAQNHFSLPAQLWKRLLTLAAIPESTPLNHISHAKLHTLANQLTADTYAIKGKTAYKHEFVTCGGVSLKEVDFKTMQSRLVPSLFFVGEILDIDGVTGGFNFQNAWTTAFLAAEALKF